MGPLVGHNVKNTDGVELAGWVDTRPGGRGFGAKVASPRGRRHRLREDAGRAETRLRVDVTPPRSIATWYPRAELRLPRYR